MLIGPPHRVTYSSTQTIAAPPARVFPLYCPVREADWVPGWQPLFVLTESGAAELDCVFATLSDATPAYWMITAYDPAAFALEMVKCTPGVTFCKISIRLEARGKRRTDATIRYSYTSLSEEGDAFLEGFGEEDYADFMQRWEEAMNHFLETGEAVPQA